ncbi:Dam family site-specific DNA-(adenine-N6)-methyltransferase [Haemophilus haemolyticus]|uniref:Dam family site-specific DNA-(adenine-N6)-methyltransferase n=1 Tax=Haemophilus haemolyticus TaxID=726 RepID=UPI000E579423|nr:Dam family site-specific DNA-(adenine-N6)-methyltransferase [Haemophilus haemolyticus]
MFKPVIKWSGSKRSQSSKIKEFLPNKFNRYYEPFIGGGSMLYAINPIDAICGDICVPLIDLWNEIKNNPVELSEAYRLRWTRLQIEGYQTYYEIRDDFNKNRSPEDLLFLSRTCVNGLIRFNTNGDFNNSLHHTRPGIAPDSLEKIILDWSKSIQGTEFIATDYIVTTEMAKKGDLIYLDPPYFHTKGRYYGTIDFEAFLTNLERLNSKGIKYMLSFDGIRGEDDFTVELPKELYKRHELIPSGNSSFKKVMDKESIQVSESLYLNW